MNGQRYSSAECRVKSAELWKIFSLRSKIILIKILFELARKVTLTLHSAFCTLNSIKIFTRKYRTISNVNVLASIEKRLTADAFESHTDLFHHSA